MNVSDFIISIIIGIIMTATYIHMIYYLYYYQVITPIELKPLVEKFDKIWYTVLYLVMLSIGCWVCGLGFFLG
jgi:hypothetical protein